MKRNRELMKADAVAEEVLQQSEAAAVQGEAQVESPARPDPAERILADGR